MAWVARAAIAIAIAVAVAVAVAVMFAAAGAAARRFDDGTCVAALAVRPTTVVRRAVARLVVVAYVNLAAVRVDHRVITVSA
jgi:hypothetical protein